MTYNYNLSKKDQARMFVFGYFNRPVFWFQRRYSGPALVLIAVAYVILNHALDGVLLGALFALVGIYMILRPFIALTRLHFEKSSGTISIGDSGITITGGLGTATFPKAKLLKVSTKGHYAFLKARMTATQYYTVDLHSIAGDQGSFVEELTKLVARKVGKPAEIKNRG